MTDIPLEIEVVAVFRTPNFAIAPALVGASHIFEFEGLKLSIKIPELPSDGKFDDEVVGLSSWRVSDGERVPLEFSIGQVQVTVMVSGAHDFPKAMLHRPPNAFDLVNEEQQNRLRSVASNHYQIAQRAFDEWSKTMRWKTGQWNLARSSFEGLESGHGSIIRQTGTAKRLWIHNNPIVIYSNPLVTADQWSNVQSALVERQSPPIFVDLLFDAEMHYAEFDIRRATIDAAVAAESFIRSTVQLSLPDGLTQAVRNVLDEANIRPVLTKVFPESIASIGESAIDKDTMSDIHKLLDVRNKLVHTGAMGDLSPEKCLRYLQSVRKILSHHIGIS